jgi:hypothetical protein
LRSPNCEGHPQSQSIGAWCFRVRQSAKRLSRNLRDLPPGVEQKDAGPQRVSAFLFAGDLRNMSDNSAVVWLDLNHKEAP